ncbi:MAG: GtrA family protein [Clostridia bacterium]|nr:GtrA family protein [Clostridia bacterium]
MKGLLEKHRHFILYVMIGTVATAVDMSIFFALTDLARLHYLTSNIISVFFGILTSFELNSRFNFKKTDFRVRRFISFAVVCVIGMGLGSFLLTAFYIWLDLPKFIAKVLSVVMAGVFQYIFNKNITFRK